MALPSGFFQLRLLIPTLALAVVALVSGFTSVATAAAPLGTQFQINSYTTNAQLYPVVAASPASDFVVVWESFGSAGSDSSGSSIQGQRFGSDGNALGLEFQVNTFGRAASAAEPTPTP